MKLTGTTDFASGIHKVSKVYFFSIFNAIISAFIPCLAQNNIAQEQP